MTREATGGESETGAPGRRRVPVFTSEVPEALARLLEAAGATALERAGNLLGLRLVENQEPEAR